MARKTPYEKSPDRIKCKSGIEGYTCKLQANYHSYSEFKSACESYGIHTRLGYDSPKTAWDDNPTIRASVTPSDLQKRGKNGRWI